MADEVVLLATQGTLPVQAGITDSLISTGGASAPHANTTIADVSAPAGTYEVRCAVGFLAGSPAGTEYNNFQLTGGATAITLPAYAALGAQPWTPAIRVTLSVAGTLAIVNPNAATSGVFYNASLIATQVA